MRKGKSPRQLKPRLLQYLGRNLFEMTTFESFLSDYSRLYLRLFMQAY